VPRSRIDSLTACDHAGLVGQLDLLEEQGEHESDEHQRHEVPERWRQRVGEAVDDAGLQWFG
jgi:hypothetical protein